MAVQQNKVSKQKIRQRKAGRRKNPIEPNKCPVCGAARLAHRVCRSCGVYGEKQILSITSE